MLVGARTALRLAQPRVVGWAVTRQLNRQVRERERLSILARRSVNDELERLQRECFLDTQGEGVTSTTIPRLIRQAVADWEAGKSRPTLTIWSQQEIRKWETWAKPAALEVARTGSFPPHTELRVERYYQGDPIRKSHRKYLCLWLDSGPTKHPARPMQFTLPLKELR